MASRSATVLIIFVIAIVAFCLASVCASMTGTISILPNGTGNGNDILDNFTDSSSDSNKISGYQGQDYSSSSDSNVETTTDDSSSSSSDNTQPSTDNQGQNDGGSNQESNDKPDDSKNDPNVVTYTG